MWVNPDEDPRNSEGAGPDGELATLRDYLHNYRLTLRLKCEDLDAEQLAGSPSRATRVAKPPECASSRTRIPG